MSADVRDLISDSGQWQLFLRQPIPTFIVDLNPVQLGLHALNIAGLLGLDEYLLRHPELIRSFLRQVKVLAVNPAALRISEALDEQDFIENFANYFTDESIRALRSTLLQIADAKEELAENVPLVTRSGRWQVVQFYMRPVRDGDLSQVICNFIEITHWRRAEEALAREQQTLMGSPVFSFRWRNDTGWPVESVSPNITQLGYTQDELLTGRLPYADIIHPDDMQRVGEEVERYCATGVAGFEQEYRIFSHDGEVRWIYDYTSIVRDPNNEITHFDGILLDITSRKEAEQALRASEQRYQEIFESNPVSIWVEDLSQVVPHYEQLRQQGVTDFRDYFEKHPQKVFELASLTRVIDVNTTTLEMFEAASKEELLGSLDKVFTAESLAGSTALHAAMAEGRRGFEVETVNQTLKGNTRHVLIKMNLPAEPDYSNLQVTLVDITARKKAEQALAVSEHELSTIFANMQDTYYRTDAQGVIVRASPAVKAMIGYEAEEVIGMPLASLYAEPEKRGEFLQALRDSKGKVTGYHINMISKSGAPVWVSTSSQFVFDEQGQVAGVEGIARNITDVVLATRALQESERRQAEANRIAQLGHYEWNVASGEVFWSDEIATLLGYAEPISPSLEGFFAHVHPDDREPLRSEVEQILQRAGVHSMLFRIVTPAGEPRILESCGEMLLGEGGEGQRMIGTLRDVTTQQHEQQELRDARDVAEQANRLKSDFLANMSHEIRTPMNGLVGFVNLLSRTELDGEQRDYVETMKTSMGDLLAIVNDILDFSRIESNKLTISLLEFDLLEAVSDVVSLFSAMATAKGLALRMELADGVPYTVEGDPVRLRQVLGNLVGNALKFTEQGEVVLRVAVESRRGEDFVLRFEVLDTGMGVDTTNVDKLFEAFTQLHTGHSGGTGLGLAISRRLVELMGGSIAYATREGGGSIFSFTLPLRRLHQEAMAQPSISDMPLHEFVGRRVLVVDDNAINRKLITTLLGQMGVETLEAENGEAALARQREEVFDLILMDIRMPRMDGLEATRQIRLGEASQQRIPIIALTAHALPHEREKFILTGMDDCLTKPVNEADLLRLLQQYLN